MLFILIIFTITTSDTQTQAHDTGQRKATTQPGMHSKNNVDEKEITTAFSRMLFSAENDRLYKNNAKIYITRGLEPPCCKLSNYFSWWCESGGPN